MPEGQTLHSVLPPAEIGTAHQLNAMTSFKNVAASICVAALIIGVAGQIMIHQLDQATAKQCATHDWPKQAHDIHMDWCAANNYSTN
jgi:hypothetical protein